MGRRGRRHDSPGETHNHFEVDGYGREVEADRLNTQISAALALLHGHLRLAQALVDVLVGHGGPPHQMAWALAELDQLQATVRDISSQHRQGGAAT